MEDKISTIIQLIAVVSAFSSGWFFGQARTYRDWSRHCRDCEEFRKKIVIHIKEMNKKDNETIQ